MNIIKATNRLLIAIFMLLSFNVVADSSRSVNHLPVLEIDKLKIKLSRDGTGIVNGIPCSKCDSHFLRITKDTKASKNGVEIDIQQIKKRAGKRVGLSYDPKTREVVFIFWYERKAVK